MTDQPRGLCRQEATVSYIIAPDPHPGRCPNHRTVYGASIQSVRCLELADTEHVCRFPEVVTASSEAVYSQQTVAAPQPWVPPPPAGTPCTKCRTHHTTPGNCNV